jgi:hypothetical protein
MITDRINNNLLALFDPENDDIYKALISDQDGTIPTTVSKPTDFDVGVIGSQIEYLRQLSITLLKQIYLDEADSEFLEYTLNTFFDSFQSNNESDADWLQRVINTVFSQKVSKASIIFLMRPYSPGGEPEVTNIITDNAFADYSYCDIYSSGNTTLDGETIYYLAAVADTFAGAFFTIKVTLYDTEYTDIFIAQDLLKEIVAAGISVILQITYT